MFILFKFRQTWWEIAVRMSQNSSKVECIPFSVDIGDMRKKYKDKSETFTEKDLQWKEPIGQFRVWFDEACKTSGIYEANGMCLATATKDGIPSSRYVLLKGYGVDGFKFFTNYESRKARDLDENPRAALTFYWEVLKKSVRVEGSVKKLSEAEGDEYFHSRPRASQIGACVSKQSSVIAGRDTLMKREKELNDLYAEGKEIPRPKYWGGYIVIPEKVEFWQGQSDRLHDRIQFRRPKMGEKPDGILVHEGENGWIYERLSP